MTAKTFAGASTGPMTLVVAAELGALLRACRNIGFRRWRLDAVARLAPAFVRQGMPLDRLRASIDECASGALCIPSLADIVRGLLDDALDGAPADVLADLVGLLFTRTSETVASGAAAAAVYLRAGDTLEHLGGVVRCPSRLDAFARRGCIPHHVTGWAAFRGDLRARGSEEAFEPTLPLVAALVDAIVATGDASRLAGAERAAAAVAPVWRAKATAHLARVDLACASTDAALRRIRSIRARGVRAGAGLLLARTALALGRLDDAHRIAAGIEASRFRQRAQLAIARFLVERGGARNLQTMLATITDPALAAERWLLWDELQLIHHRCTELPHETTPAMLRAAEPAPAWIGEAPLDVHIRAELVRSAGSLRGRLRAGSRSEVAAFGRRWYAFDRHANRVLHGILERIGVAPLDAIKRIRAYADILDALQAEAIVVRAERAVTAVPSGDDASRAVRIRRQSAAFDALCGDDPLLAAHLVLSRPAEICVDTHRALASVVEHAGLPDGFVEAYGRAEAAVDRAFGLGRGEGWLAELVAAWRHRHGGLPSTALLRAVVVRRRLPRDPAKLLDLLERVALRIDARSHAALAVRAAFDGRVLSMLLAGRPAQLDPGLAPWPRKRWRDLVRAAAGTVFGGHDLLAVSACAKRMRRDVRTLLAGDLVGLGATARMVLGIDGRDHVIRLLDKRRDLLTYLRVGDVPARSAYRSDAAECARDLVVDAWRDPLTACFRVDRWYPEGMRPSGFVVGRLVDRGEGPVTFEVDDLHLQSGNRHARDVVHHAVGQMIAPVTGRSGGHPTRRS